MPPRILYLVRHAEGQHNVNHQHNIRDPILTPRGQTQCATLSKSFPYQDSITQILCSPLKRTIQTTLETFTPAIIRLSAASSSFKITANPLFQESNEWECDIGSSVSDIQNHFQGTLYFDFVDLSTTIADPIWPLKPSESIWSAKNIIERTLKARKYLYENTEGDVVLVTHGGFLHYLTDDWEGFNGMVGTGWNNTDWRSYEIEGGDGYPLKETRDSVERRRKEGRSNGLSQTEKEEIEETEKKRLQG